MAPDDIREIKQALQDLAIVTAKLTQAVENNKENQLDIIKGIKEVVKETKKENDRAREMCQKEMKDRYDKHSNAITEHGKDIATIKESISGIKSNYKSVASLFAIVITAIFNFLLGVFK